jgi:lysozyme family protein
MNFDAAFNIVVGIEAGYSNNPADPGGETKYGITKRQYPQIDIKNLTLDQAKAIYQRDYWSLCRCDELPWDMALVVFDCAVNQGPGTAERIHLLASTPIEFQAERALRYAQLPTFPTFGRGWMRRLFTIFKASQVPPE